MRFELNEKSYLAELERELAIDSVTGQYHELQDYFIKEIKALGFQPEVLRKGGIIVDAGGEGDPLLVTAHGDTIGLMVRHINDDGTLKVCKVGGLYAYHTERENVRIHTRTEAVFTGTVQRKNASVHVTEDELNKMWIIRKVLAPLSSVDAMTLLLDKLSSTKSNKDFLKQMEVNAF